MSDVITLLKTLVATPSLSGNETAAANVLTSYLRDHGLQVERMGDNVVCRIKGAAPGPTFLLNSHLDTVPAKDGWDTDPWTPQVVDGRLYGLGSGDAKASVCAMANAMVNTSIKGLECGELIFAATVLEETGGGGLEEIRPALGTIDGALVGEPTSLHAAVAQSGMMIVKASAHGRTAHAARSHLGDNALTIAAHDLVVLSTLVLDRVHPHLGQSSANVTVLQGGDRHNVIPDLCTYTIDVRYTPSYTPAEIFAQLDALTRAELRIHSDRFLPVETPGQGALLEALLLVAPNTPQFGSPTMSDWVHLKHTPAIKIGPGQSEFSHTPNESVALDEVLQAVELYANVAHTFLSSNKVGES